MMPDPIVRVDGLTKRFGTFTAVDHVTFEIEPGEVIGYLGPNGSGKTTTIRMLLGLLRPTEGEASVLGLDAARQAEAIRPQVGYMSQKFALYDELTAWENLAFYAGVYGVADRSRQAESLELVGLTHARDERAGSLPLGWRQRLALATAVVHRPTLLFLDEPTSGVDPLARRAFWDLIYEMAERGVTILVTTHYMDEAEYCGRVGIMRRGRLLAMKPTSELKRTAFHGKAWDVYARPIVDALDALAKLPEVQRTGLSGDHLRAISREDLPPEAIEDWLEGFGLQDVAAYPTTPTLEDVFLALSD
jgi:ABC-2 type transport system ATP-binding protein